MSLKLVHQICVLIAMASSEGSDQLVHIHTVLPEPLLLAYTKYESRGSFRSYITPLASHGDSKGAFVQM